MNKWQCILALVGMGLLWHWQGFFGMCVITLLVNMILDEIAFEKSIFNG